MAKLDLLSVPVVAEHNAAIPMRDGTLLRADIYRPAQAGPFPALLIRTPYGEPAIRTAPVLLAIDAGFAVVLQYCRGTGTSDGDFTPFEGESDDGVDSIEWCARQDWCDGRVGMWGSAYAGMVQLAAAVQARQLLGWYTMKSAQTLAYRAAPARTWPGSGPHCWRTRRTWLPSTVTCRPARCPPSAAFCRPGSAGSTTSDSTSTGGTCRTQRGGTRSPLRRCTWVAGSTCSSVGDPKANPAGAP